MDYEEFLTECKDFKPKNLQLTPASRFLNYNFSDSIHAAAFRGGVASVIDQYDDKVSKKYYKLPDDLPGFAFKTWQGTGQMIVITNNDEAFFIASALAGRQPVHQLLCRPVKADAISGLKGAS